VVTLDPELEKLLMESIQQSEHGSYLSLEPRVTQVILNNLSTEIQKLVSIGEQPIVLTAPIVRFYFKNLTEQMIPDLIVLSYNEIDSDVEVQSIGTVKL
jgi:flagellar biosynthesis protein FlhA